MEKKKRGIVLQTTTNGDGRGAIPVTVTPSGCPKAGGAQLRSQLGRRRRRWGETKTTTTTRWVGPVGANRNSCGPRPHGLRCTSPGRRQVGSGVLGRQRHDRRLQGPSIRRRSPRDSRGISFVFLSLAAPLVHTPLATALPVGITARIKALLYQCPF